MTLRKQCKDISFNIVHEWCCGILSNFQHLETGYSSKRNNKRYFKWHQPNNFKIRTKILF